MNIEHTVSTAAEEQESSPKISDQNFEENPSKLMNYEDSNSTVVNDHDSFPIEEDLNGKSRRKAPHKHLMNNHDLRSIVNGKRSRRQADSNPNTSHGAQGSLHNLRDMGDPPKRSMNLRNQSKLQAKMKVRGEMKLNNLFKQASNYDKSWELDVNTKDIFENVYQKIKKMNELNSNEPHKRIVPEKRRVSEVASVYGPKSEGVGQQEKEYLEMPFFANRNILQKQRDFGFIKKLDMTENNFPKAKPELLNQKAHEIKLEDIRHRIEQAQQGITRKMDKVIEKQHQHPSRKADKVIPHIAVEKLPTYINCDLRYFNFDFLTEKLGSFDVILMDPPFRSRNGQQNNSTQTLTKNKQGIEYDTMSNKEIMSLRIEKLSKKGFLFLWIELDQLNAAYEMLNKWGYEVVDQIIWVKLKDKKVFLAEGDNFMHSFEMCLFGYKCPPGEVVEYMSKVSNNIIFAEVKKRFQKPDLLYDIIDQIMPGAKKIELFAQNHNLRPGWFSLGNQLGEEYEIWYNQIDCNHCKISIPRGSKLYKARKQANYDLCANCFQNLDMNRTDFFELNNLAESLLHQYHSCRKCGTSPIWGTRFTCLDCENFDLCESCFDTNLQSDVKFHDINHNFHPVEVPLLANGLPPHSTKKCGHCSQKPILGVCFTCTQCPSLHFCQNCYFSKSPEEMKKFEGHKTFHSFNISTEPTDQDNKDNKPYKCFNCEVFPIHGTPYKCEECFNIYFCEKCYFKRDSFQSRGHHSHKFYHNFMALSASE